MKHYQTPETLVLQVVNNQTLCASAPTGLVQLNKSTISKVGWDAPEE